jgi:hypothetical protein
MTLPSKLGKFMQMKDWLENEESGGRSAVLCFVLALKSKAIAQDWQRVSQLFEATLRSAYQQTDADFQIIAVCHEIPTLTATYDQRLELIQVDFPPPPDSTDRQLTMQDKWNKIAVGLVRAGALNSDFVMIMDADDLVSRHLAAYANTHKAENGWIFTHGYRYQYGSRWISVDDRFNCGTNAIVNGRLIRFPTSVDPKEIAKCVVLTHGHTAIAHHLAALNTPLRPLPFAGAVYVCAHGDNWTDFSDRHSWHGIRYALGRLRRLRPLTRRLRQDFAMEPGE